MRNKESLALTSLLQNIKHNSLHFNYKNHKTTHLKLDLLMNTHSNHFDLAGAINIQIMKLVIVFWCFNFVRCATKVR
jgi:hypothetical protein